MAYCLSLGDTSQSPWAIAPEWQRESAIAGVCFHINNPSAGPSGSHESWLRQKENDGWAYGPVKDAVAKTHPCMVPYDQLSKENQIKDALFVQVVHSMRDMFEDGLCCGCFSDDE